MLLRVMGIRRLLESRCGRDSCFSDRDARGHVSGIGDVCVCFEVEIDYQISVNHRPNTAKGSNGSLARDSE